MYDYCGCKTTLFLFAPLSSYVKSKALWDITAMNKVSWLESEMSPEESHVEGMAPSRQALELIGL